MELDLQLRLHPEVPGALRGDALDGQGLSPLPRLARDRPERVPARGGSRRRVDLFRRVLRVGRTNYSASADGEPDEEGERLIEFAREARRIIRERRPEGSFSGEWPSELKVPVMDYMGLAQRLRRRRLRAVPLRVPQFRLNANVGAHPRGPVVAFMEDALLNVMPGGLLTERLADHPRLVDLLRRLTTLRHQFLSFFTEGRFRHLEAADVEGGDARVFTHGADTLVIVANLTDADATVTVSVDLDRLGVPGSEWTVEAHTLDGSVARREATGVAFRATELLGPDELVVLHLHAREPSP